LENKNVELKLKEKEHQDSPVVTIKNWGDAMRNTITKMPSESIEIVSWFMSVEKLFDQLTFFKKSHLDKTRHHRLTVINTFQHSPKLL